MLNWFRKKEKFHSEICIPKIMINNEIEFNYECVVEVASILINDSNTKERVVQAINNSKQDFSDEVLTPDPNKDVVKIYTMNGIDSDDKLIMAVVDESSSKEDPYLLTYKYVKSAVKKSRVRRKRTVGFAY